jgi:hypothetical protein
MPPTKYERDDFKLTIGFVGSESHPTDPRGAETEFQGRLVLDRDMVVSLRQEWIRHDAVVETQIGHELFRLLVNSVPEFESWLLNSPGLDVDWERDEHYDTSVPRYRLPRLLLHFENRDLVALPWEAMVDQWHTSALVVRRSPTAPTVAGRKLDLPLHLAQVVSELPHGPEDPFELVPAVEQVFWSDWRQALHPGMDLVVETRTGAHPDDIGREWGRTDVLHLTVIGAAGDRDSHTLRDRIRLQDGTLVAREHLAAWLSEQRTRLLVLHAADWRSGVRARLLLLAHDLAARGGPPVLIAQFPSEPLAAREFFTHYYDRLIHDTPIDFAPFLLRPNDFIPQPRTGQRWLSAHLPLITGPGGEDLLRFSALLFEIDEQRQALIEEVGTQRQWATRLYDWLEGKRKEEPVSQRGLERLLDSQFTLQLQEQAARFEALQNRLQDLGADLLFDPRHEAESSIPMVRGRDEIEEGGVELGAAIEEVRQSVAERTARYVNTWFVAGERTSQGRIMRSTEMLELKGRYLLHVDIGPRPREQQSIVIDPVDIAGVLESLYELHDEQGVTLEVGLFGEDFWVGLARQEPEVAHDVWRRPREEWPSVDCAWQRPRSGTTLDYLWLSRIDPSRPLCFSVQPRRTGMCRLRLCIYYRNNLLQSLLLEARVVRVGAGEDLEQLRGIGPERAGRLAAVGIKDLAALSVADPQLVADVARGGARQARHWVETADRLGALGNEARIEYTTNADFVGVWRAPKRSVTLFTNSNGSTHSVGLKTGGWDEQWGQGDDWTYQKSLTEAKLESILQAVRHDLAEASSIMIGGVPTGYAYDDQNRGTTYNLGQALYRLAVQGRRLYSDFFKDPAQRELERRLAEEKRTIHVARVAGTYVVPWSVIYDRPLSYEQKWRPKYVCLHALEQMAKGKCEDCPGGAAASLSSAALTQVLDRNVDPDGVDVYVCEDASLCAQAAHDPQHVVCLWGFWGFKHLLEQPPQGLTAERPEPRALKDRVTVKGQPALNMNVSTTLDFAGDRTHLNQIKALEYNGQPLAVVYAGEDGPGRLGVESVIEALRKGDQSLIYFYCHGGAVRDKPQDPLEPFLAVGSSDRQQIRPVTLDNEKYTWPNAPLVLINACKSVALEPDLLGDFVRKFAEHGAAGVIGTEVSVWEPLAVEVANFFFEEFLKGRPVGEILLELRHMLLQKHNPLGLIYTNYCSVDLMIESA